MQSTGHTSTQAVSFVSIQGSVMMNGIAVGLRLRGQDPIGKLEDFPHYRARRVGIAGSSSDAARMTSSFTDRGLYLPLWQTRRRRPPPPLRAPPPPGMRRGADRSRPTSSKRAA